MSNPLSRKPRRATLRPLLAVLVFSLTLHLPLALRGRITNAPTPSLNSPSHASTSTPKQAARPQLQERYGKLPLSFEANHGQTDAQVKFVSRAPGYTLFLTATEAVLKLRAAERGTLPAARAAQSSTGNSRSSVVQMKLLGARAAPQVEGQDQLPGQHNYFIGKDQKKWRAGVPSYARVRYEAVYPGVDLVYYGNQQQLEYDFVVAPGADPQQIKLSFAGADAIKLDEAGNLVLQTPSGDLIQHAPVIYQETERGRATISGGYALAGDQVTFQIGAYDASRPLVIDPVLAMATYLGGSLLDNVVDMTMDAAGNVYCTGQLNSTEFPSGSGDKRSSAAYVAKFSADGTTLIYATVLDGESGDDGEAIAVNSSGQAFVAGNTSSDDFPLLAPFQDTRNPGNGAGRDGFVVRLDANGVLNGGCGGCSYSTYLGGRSSDNIRGIAVASNNRVYVTGETESTNFPTHNPFQDNGAFSGEDAFLTVFSSTGQTLVYSTYFRGGGIDREKGANVAVDSAGNAYIIGNTNGNNIRTRGAADTSPAQANNAGGFDAFVAKFNPSLSGDDSLIYATYLGGSGTEFTGDIAVDAQQRAYVTGQTGSLNFPRNAVPGATILDNTNEINEAFVTCFNANGSARVFSTFLGGNGQDEGNAIALDSTNNIYVNLSTTSRQNLPLVNPVQANLAGSLDSYIAKLAPDARSILFSTYLGGSGTDESTGIAVLPNGTSVAVGGTTLSTNFPTTAGAVQTELGGNRDGFVARIKFENPDTIGVFRPAATEFRLSNSNTTPSADIVVDFGLAGVLPVTGDWNNDGVDTVGTFNNGAWSLRNNNVGYATGIINFTFGQAGDLPVVGDWNGDGVDTIGVFRNGTFFLRNSNSAGNADIIAAFGQAGDLPVAGDWNGDGVDTIGFFRPGAIEFQLSNSNTAPNADIRFFAGFSNDLPVAGDWNDDGIDTVGLFRDGTFFLIEPNITISVVFGAAGDRPLGGNWDGRP